MLVSGPVKILIFINQCLPDRAFYFALKFLKKYINLKKVVVKLSEICYIYLIGRSVTMYKRVVLKLSGEALAADSGKCFDNPTISSIVSQIKTVIENGTQLTLVIGGGNFWRGRSANPEMDRVKADQIGMLATVMNAVYFADFCRQEGLEAVVMTPFNVGNITELFSKDKANKLLNDGKVLIFAGGIGHPFFSTDTVTALRASELNADAILFAKNIDGVYDSDPSVNPNAKKFDEIPCKDIVEKNLKVIDIAAANLCYEQRIPVEIFGLAEENSIIRAANGEKIGTTVTV